MMFFSNLMLMFSLIIINFLLFNNFLFAGEKIKVHLDCRTICDTDYLKENMAFVSFVRDISDADVNILITSLPTSSGGKKYTMEFKGLGKMENIDDTVVFTTEQNDSNDAARNKMLLYLKLGLVRYIVKNGDISGFNISYNPLPVEKSKDISNDDPWKKWIFKAGTNFSIMADKTYSNINVGNNFSASKTLEKNKFTFNFYYTYSRNKYRLSGANIINISRSYDFSPSYVYGFDEHWSSMVKCEIESSDYYNRKRSVFTDLAVEYSLLPYSVATTKSIKFQYFLEYRMEDYFKRTIYFKNSEDYWVMKLRSIADINRKWGSLSSSLSYEKNINYSNSDTISFHIFSSFRISKSVSLNLSSMFSLLSKNAQRYLVSEDLSDEEILIRKSALETTYNWYSSIGITYTFGSIYESVVNT